MPRIRFLILASLSFLLACEARPTDPGGRFTVVPPQVQCSVDAVAQTMSCVPAGGGGASAQANLIVGGQDRYVQLAPGPVIVAGNVLSVSVTVRNLTVQAMGTPDGTTVSPQGVRVFFASGPSHGVMVTNADSVGRFTGRAQPYFQYNGILEPQEASGARTWSFALNGATSFSFGVYVVAEVPSESGFLRIEEAELDATSHTNDVWGSGSTRIVVTSDRTILRSTDAGATWASITSGATFGLNAVWGNASVALAVGNGGIIQRSTDLGGTWTTVPVGTNAFLLDVHGVDSTVVVVGSQGLILRSTDAGKTWANVASGTDLWLTAVWGNGNTMLAVGAGGVILRSQNAGASWVPVRAVDGVTLSDVYGADSTIVAVGYSGAIRRSSDDGRTWTNANSGTTTFLWGIAAADSTMIAVGDSGLIRRSTDAGVTWHTLRSGVDSSLKGVWMADEREALFVGGDGLILRATR